MDAIQSHRQMTSWLIMIATIRVKSSLSLEIDKIDKNQSGMEVKFALTASHGIYIYSLGIKH